MGRRCRLTDWPAPQLILVRENVDMAPSTTWLIRDGTRLSERRGMAIQADLARVRGEYAHETQVRMKTFAKELQATGLTQAGHIDALWNQLRSARRGQPRRGPRRNVASLLANAGLPEGSPTRRASPVAGGHRYNANRVQGDPKPCLRHGKADRRTLPLLQMNPGRTQRSIKGELPWHELPRMTKNRIRRSRRKKSSRVHSAWAGCSAGWVD